MSKLEFEELMFEKETMNFNRYSFSRIINDGEEVRGTLYLPKNAREIKVNIEYV